MTVRDPRVADRRQKDRVEPGKALGPSTGIVAALCQGSARSPVEPRVTRAAPVDGGGGRRAANRLGDDLGPIPSPGMTTIRGSDVIALGPLGGLPR